jgi:hypothetical protein
MSGKAIWIQVEVSIQKSQSLSFEQRKALIKALFEQLPKTEPLAGSIPRVGDLEAASVHTRKLVSHSIQRTAEQLRFSLLCTRKCLISWCA